MDALSLTDTSFRGSAQRHQQAPRAGDVAAHQGPAIGPIACPPSQAQHPGDHLPPHQQAYRQGPPAQQMHAGMHSSDDIQAFGNNSVPHASHYQQHQQGPHPHQQNTHGASLPSRFSPHPEGGNPQQQQQQQHTSHAMPLAGIPEDMELRDDKAAPAGPTAASAIFGLQHPQQQQHGPCQATLLDEAHHRNQLQSRQSRQSRQSYGHAPFPRHNSDTALPQHHAHHQHHHRSVIGGRSQHSQHMAVQGDEADASKHLNGPLLSRLDSGLSTHAEDFHHNYQYKPYHQHQPQHEQQHQPQHEQQHQPQHEQQQQQQQHGLTAQDMHSDMTGIQEVGSGHPHLMPGQAPWSAESTSDLEHDDDGAGGPQPLEPTLRDTTVEGPEYIHPDTLAQLLTMQAEHVLLLDCRATLDFQLSHIYGAVPVWFSRLMLKRLKRKAGAISVADLPDAPAQALHKRHDPNVLTVIYDEDCLYSPTEDNAVSMLFHILRAENLQPMLVRGGFKAFRLTDPHLVVARDEEYRPHGLQRILQPHDLSVHDTVLKIPASKIFSYLYVGNARQGRSSEFVAKHNITHVLNVSEEPCASNVFMRVQCMQVPLVDGPGHDLLSIIPQVIQFIEGARIGGGRVLIYCTNGLSRSVAILLAYMISTRKYTLSSAYSTVQTLRPNTSPHVCFLTQLVEYEAIVKQASTRSKRRTRSADV